MQHPWFKKWGWLYRPITGPGFVVIIFLLLFFINTFVAIDRSSHSVSDTIYGIFPYWLPAFLFYLWLADHTSV